MQERNSFTFSDKLHAKEAISHLQARSAETADEYALRKRKAELYALVRKVIKEELNPIEQKIVKLHWYDELSLTEVAEKMGLDRSTISRKNKKINSIIYDKLKYAVEYRFGKSYCSEAEEIIKTPSPSCWPYDGDKISERIKNLRLRHAEEKENIAPLLGITAKRLTEIEKDGSSLTMEELKSLSRFYEVTSDYIIFGLRGSPERGVVQ